MYLRPPVTAAANLTPPIPPQQGKLTLTGPTTASAFQTALRSIYFKASSTYHLLDIPNFHNKLVSFKVTDATTAVSTLDLRAINVTGPTRVYTEGVPAIITKD